MYVRSLLEEKQKLEGCFELEIEASKVEKDKLLSLPNSRYVELIGRCRHLKEVTMNDVDVKNEIPVHLILGARESVSQN